MISSVTGEIDFSDGLHFRPQEELSEIHIRDALSHTLLPVPGWSHHRLGIHPSDHGAFEVEAVSDRQSRIQTVFMAHTHPFYQRDTPNDSERRAFHESILGQDLHGQREFSWGEALCHLDAVSNKDWLVIVYTQGPHVPRPRLDLLLHLYEHEPIPLPQDLPID